jgi:hypothetical protein
LVCNFQNQNNQWIVSIEKGRLGFFMTGGSGIEPIPAFNAVTFVPNGFLVPYAGAIPVKLASLRHHQD